MGPKRNKTRQVSGLLVAPCELPVADLPTLKDVLAKCTAEKEKLPSNCSVQEVLPAVLQSIKDIYHRVNSNLVLHPDKLLGQRIKSKFEEMKQINRSKTSSLSKAKFDKILGEIFEVLVCTCTIVKCSDFECSGCEFDAHVNCDCPKNSKIPKKELTYLLDQRSRTDGVKGKLQMKGADLKEMADMNKTINRKQADNLTSVTTKKRESDWKRKIKMVDNAEDSLVAEEVDYPHLEDDSNKDEDFTVPEAKSKTTNTMSLRNLAKECDRWGVSNRAGAAIANAVLIDAGVITAENQKNVIDKNKLRRALEDYREERQTVDYKTLEDKQGKAYYIDGKKTMSLCVEEDDQGKKYNAVRELELISMASEPGGPILSHWGVKGSKLQQQFLSF